MFEMSKIRTPRNRVALVAAGVERAVLLRPRLLDRHEQQVPVDREVTLTARAHDGGHERRRRRVGDVVDREAVEVADEGVSCPGAPCRSSPARCRTRRPARTCARAACFVLRAGSMPREAIPGLSRPGARFARGSVVEGSCADAAEAVTPASSAPPARATSNFRVAVRDMPILLLLSLRPLAMNHTQVRWG